MRRWMLLALLWTAGTAVATGVVFEAVVVMSHTFRDAAGESPASRRPTRTTTIAPGRAPETTESSPAVTTAPPAEPSTTETATTEVRTTASSGPDGGPAPTGSATSTGTRTTPPPTGATTSPGGGTVSPPPSTVTVVPTTPTTPATISPPTTPPTTSPTTAATTTVQAPPPTCTSQLRKVAAGPNSFYVRVCPDDSSVRLVLSSVQKGVTYSAHVGSSGPAVVDIVFEGPTNYHCTITVSDGVMLGYPCASA